MAKDGRSDRILTVIWIFLVDFGLSSKILYHQEIALTSRV